MLSIQADRLVTLSMETGLTFLMTLHAQGVLHFAPLATGLIFGVPGLASVAAGIIAGRLIGRHGSHTVLTVGVLTRAAFAARPMPLGPQRVWLAVLIPALLVGFFGHVTSIVAYTAVRYVEALGGWLDLVAECGDRTVRLPVSDTLRNPAA